MNQTLKNILMVAAVGVIGFGAYLMYDLLTPLSFEEKLAEIIHHEDRRLADRTLYDFLKDDNPIIRAKAVLAVGRIGGVTPVEGDDAARVILPILEDPATEVARSAAFAIQLTYSREIVPELVSKLESVSQLVAPTLIKSIGRLADTSMPNALEAISARVNDPSPDIRAASCMALFYSRATQYLKELPLRLAAEQNEEVRLAALYAMSRPQIAEGYSWYVQYLADADPNVRAMALRGLGGVQSDTALHYLDIALNDENVHVSATAIASIVTRKSLSSAENLAAKLARTDNELLAQEILNALAALKSDRGAEATRTIFLNYPSDNVLAAALRYLATVDGEATVPLLDSLVNSQVSPKVRVAIADAYQTIGGQYAMPRMVLLLKDPDPLVRATAFGALMSVDSTNANLYIDQALADVDMIPVSSAVDQIGSGKRVEYLDQMMALLNDGPPVDIRRSIVELVPAFWNEPLPNDSFPEQLLLTAAGDDSYIVRRRSTFLFDSLVQEHQNKLLGEPQVQFSKTDIVNAIKELKENPEAVLTTTKGEIAFTLRFDLAPLTVLNFMKLVEDGYYDGVLFHRVVPNFVVQGGDPRGDGYGGPNYEIRCEYSEEPYERGTVGMATSGKDTGGSQFFFTIVPTSHLNGRYTIFGNVTEGMDVIDRMVVGDSIRQVTIVRKGIAE